MAERKKNQDHGAGRGRQGTKFYITALDSSPALKGGLNAHDENELSQEERERVIEILLGQDKVIALLYDRPPAAASGSHGADGQETQGSAAMFGEHQLTQEQMLLMAQQYSSE